MGVNLSGEGKQALEELLVRRKTLEGMETEEKIKNWIKQLQNKK